MERKTDTMSKRTLKTNIIKMCVKVKLVVSMNKHGNGFYPRFFTMVISNKITLGFSTFVFKGGEG